MIAYDTRWNVNIARYFNPIDVHQSGLLQESAKIFQIATVPYIIKVAKKNYHF